MKKLLPIIIFVFSLFLFVGVIHHPVFAQTPTPQAEVPDGSWVQDQEVTFVGKTADRAQDFLTWALTNYNWACVQQTGNVETSCSNPYSNNPLFDFWKSITEIVYVFLILFVLAAAFIIILTRGQNLTVMRFIPRFVIIIVLVTLSYSLVQFIYVGTDIIQGCFLRLDCRNTSITNNIITSGDLLHVAFQYPDFIGYRVIGAKYEESAFVSLLLVRLTAYTYYAMTLILLARKIILWFFIIVSSIFPLLLFFHPLRNSAKIWIGEFFRWLLYAPLFAIFLHGLVMMWRATTISSTTQTNGIPLFFNFDGSVQYLTAINILIGGPGQSVSSTNSVNNPNTFAQYVVALLMLWIVILLPFLLLNIFLDYLKSLSLKDNTVFKQLVARGRSFIGRPPVAPVPIAPPPQGGGLARSLPLSGGTVRTIEIQSSAAFHDTKAAAEIMRLTNLSIPKMRDIARYESNLLSQDATHKQEVSHVSTTLEKIANPALASNPSERQRFTTMKEKLVQQKQKGDPVATSILSASSALATSKSVATGSKVGSQVEQFNTKVAAGTQQQGQIGVSQQARLPVVNKVQQVSLEDYEEVRKMWEENYKNLEPPKSVEGQIMTRRQWVKNDVQNINQAVSLLTSVDPVKNKEGMDMVANILPFLLIGGFSRSEVIAYLKAKLEAAKSTITEIEKREEAEDELLEVQKKKKEEEKSMTTEETEPVSRQKGLEEQENEQKPDNPIFDITEKEKKV